jgi:ABC-type glutathione transport system ATPase component
VLELVGLSKRSHHRPYELSGGEQQRVAIARALANKPSIILADEPTGELDSNTAQSIFRLLLQIVETEGVTILTTTHDRMVMEKAQHVIELSDGALLPEPRAFAKKEAVSVTWTAPAPAPAEKPRPQEPRHELDDSRERWAPPQRPQRAIYQPPGPPREPL